MDLDSIPVLSTIKRLVFSCLPCGRTTIGSHQVRIGAQFAEGGFSSVFRCTDLKTGSVYALKQMIASEKEQADQINAEIRIHERFQHPNLLALLDYSKTNNHSGQTIYRLLFPLYEAGSVGDVIARMRSVGKIFSEEHALHLFRQVLAGLSVMHSASPVSIAHHDIKPENVLLTDESEAVLMDFGSACQAEYDTNDRKRAADLKDWAAEHCTMPYRAPELFEPRNYDAVTASSDVWSLGCMLFAMAYGMSPFEAQLDSSGAKLQFVECSYLRVLNDVPFPQPARYSKKFITLIQDMLSPVPASRPTVKQLLGRVDEIVAVKMPVSPLPEGKPVNV